MEPLQRYPTRIGKDGILRAQAYGYWYRAEIRECYYCGKDFIFLLTFKSKGRVGYYCSRECFGKGHAKNWLRKRVEKRCPVCKTKFMVKPSNVKKKTTCGREYCNVEWKRRAMTAYWAKQKGRSSVQ